MALLATSCRTLTESASQKAEGQGSESGGSSRTDSIEIDMDFVPSDDIVGESAEPEETHHVMVTSNDILFFPEQGKLLERDRLRVVAVNNPRVISKSTNMSEGRVVYKIPERMKIRGIYQVLLRISKSKNTLSVYDNLEGTVRTSEIPVTQTMEAKLIDPSPADNKSFDIVADNNSVQVVDSGETYTEWTWDVTPIRTGSSNLKIVVSIVRDGNRKDAVYEDMVLIEKDIPVEVSFFWNKYWQWIIGTFFLPFFLWLYKRSRDKK